MPLNFAKKAFSYNLARFWASFCCKLYNILLSRMRISQKILFCWLISNFFLASFASLFLSLSFSLTTTLYPLSIHWKRFGLNPSKKNGNGTLIDYVTCPYSTTNFAPKLDLFFSGIALPEFGRYSKWTHVWIDCPCCVSCLSKQSGVVRKRWRHKWFNVSPLKRPQSTTLDGKEFKGGIYVNFEEMG